MWTYLWNKIIGDDFFSTINLFCEFVLEQFLGQIVSEMNSFCQKKFRKINFSHIYFFENFFTCKFFSQKYTCRVKVVMATFFSKNITRLSAIKKSRMCQCGFLIYVIICNSIVGTRSNNFNWIKTFNTIVIYIKVKILNFNIFENILRLE